MLQTEFEFSLPCGYVDERGNLHRQGSMRRATALDEVEPLRDVRVRNNEAYLGILLLSRVITRLGNIREITPVLIEHLFATDYIYLQQLYAQVNDDDALIETQCPHCGSHFLVNILDTYEQS